MDETVINPLYVYEGIEVLIFSIGVVCGLILLKHFSFWKW